MAIKNPYVALAGFGAALFVASAIAKAIEKDVVASEIKKARDALFEVEADCGSISFKGGTGAPDPEKMELADRYYFEPFVRRYVDDAESQEKWEGEADITMITALVLYEMFPECADRDPRPWPPESLFTAGTFGLIWVAMRIHISSLVESVREDQGLTP